MTEPTLDTLTRRLDRLERENGRWKQAVRLLLLGIGAVMVMGQVLPKSGTLTTESLMVVDSTGTTRATLSAREGIPVLAFFDGNGKARATLQVQPDGSPVFALVTGDGTGGLWLSVNNGKPLLDAGDNDRKNRVFLGLTKEGNPGSAMVSNGKIIWKAP
jgi:hypothetical protein